FNHRHIPIVSSNAANCAAQSSPLVERLGSEFHMNVKRAATFLRKMKTVAWRASSETGCKGRRSSFKVGARAADRIRIDNDARIAICNVLIACWRLNSLIVDASVSHHDAKFYKSVNQALFQAEHCGSLAKKLCLGKIGAARICYCWNSYASLPFSCRGEGFKPRHTCLAEAFRIRHDVRLGYRNEIICAEERTTCNLVLERTLRNGAKLTRTNVALFFGEIHLCQSQSRARIMHGLAPLDHLCAVKFYKCTPAERRRNYS